MPAAGPVGVVVMVQTMLARLYRLAESSSLAQAVLLPMVYVELNRRLERLKVFFFDRVFTQVRFRDDSELRAFVNHKLANSTAGFKVETSDDAHGAAEVLQDHDIDLCSYDIRAEGAAPVHATHLPLESPSSLQLPLRPRSLLFNSTCTCSEPGGFGA